MIFLIELKHMKWMPLNGIKDSGMNRLMESNFSIFGSPKLLSHI